MILINFIYNHNYNAYKRKKQVKNKKKLQEKKKNFRPFKKLTKLGERCILKRYRGGVWKRV